MATETATLQVEIPKPYLALRGLRITIRADRFHCAAEILINNLHKRWRRRVKMGGLIDCVR